jgi:hypothetical protein
LHTPRTLWLIALAVVLAACQQTAEEEAAPADTTAAESAGMPEAPHEMTYSLVVTNPMPHAMNVTATMADGSQVQLGTVPAGGESSFSLTGMMGESVSLTAADDASTHSPTGSVSLAEETTVRWTVE